MKNLADRLPAEGVLGGDEILTEFIDWAAAAGYALYPAQEESILELHGGKHVILSTPTGSGKSLVALFLHWKGLCEQRRSVYTSPIKALVNEKFFALCRELGPAKVGMMTGDASINRDAPVLCCTAEILANLCVSDRADLLDYVVMDEFHYYADRERGVAWQLPLLTLPATTFLLMSATLGDTTGIERGLHELTSREVVAITRTERPVPLEYEYAETPLHETIEKLLERQRAPIYLVNFTQRGAAEEAQNLTSVNLLTRDEKDRVKEAARAVRFDSPYGKELQRFLSHGIGLHHAGLLPRYRLFVEKLAQSGLLKVISGTDTLGVGVNIPLRTVLFSQLCKFDGQKTAILSVRDFRQIAGRAGRKGFDDLGTVVVQAPAHIVENLRLREKAAAGKGNKKPVMKQAPQKGYVPWDRSTLDRLREKPPEPLESRFDISFGLMLQVLQTPTVEKHGGYGFLLSILRRSHESERKKAQLKRTAAERFRALRHAGIVEVLRRKGQSATVSISSGIDRDFSLNHALSLYLVDTLAKFDVESETYALDVLSLCESILENPDVVLRKQTDKAKDAKMAEMKANGMEYAERMAELEKVEYPKPLAEFLYATFNDFAGHHPWINKEHIRPKSVARELVESFVSFADYVTSYGLERSEGVLLRYLSNAYRALQQSLPERYRTDEVNDVALTLRELVRQTDSSLLDEWESMQAPLVAAANELGLSIDGVAARPRLLAPDLITDPKILAAQIRTELHAILRLLDGKKYAEVIERIDGDGAPDAPPWTVARLDAEMAPYFAEHGKIVLTPAARRPTHTLLKREVVDGAARWQAMQRIVDPEGDEDWAIHVTAAEPASGERVKLVLDRIGI